MELRLKDDKTEELGFTINRTLKKIIHAGMKWFIFEDLHNNTNVRSKLYLI